MTKLLRRIFFVQLSIYSFLISAAIFILGLIGICMLVSNLIIPSVFNILCSLSLIAVGTVVPRVLWRKGLAFFESGTSGITRQEILLNTMILTCLSGAFFQVFTS